MPVNLAPPGVLASIAGVRIGVAQAGIKRTGRDDVVVFECAQGSTVAAVFTQNAFCAAPVRVAREHLALATPRYWVINTGNANAGTGADGMAAARTSCEALARLAGCAAQEVLPFSTGVIGEPLPVARLTAALPAAFVDLSPDNWLCAAGAIMTTDTVPKGASRIVEHQGARATLTGIVKGSGMIRPDMATMLAFLATDAAVPQDLLQQALARAVTTSFNRITVDGDTSTNDACMLMATANSDYAITSHDEHFTQFAVALESLCAELAQAVVRDGEGATKFITLRVVGGMHEAECLQAAYAVAHSPLVKTAFFASDPNWGRILAAVGRAGITDLQVDRVTIYLDEVCIVRAGARDPAYRESDGQRVMQRADITVLIDLGRGSRRAILWTTDLSHDYVRINAEYRT